MSNPIAMARNVRHSDGRVCVYHYYWCPGCDELHGIAINPDKQENGAGWDFSGTLECPTYSPSQLSKYMQGGKEFVCHTFIRAGRIQFLNDCTHGLKGQTVSLPPLPDWFVHGPEREEDLPNK